MARPQKQGLDYFPLDVVCNGKIELIEAEFGLTGFAVVVKLFQRIYGERGYYCEWTDEVALLFGKKNGLGGNAVSEIVGASIKRGIFDKTMFEKYGILTSVGIQERYFEAVSRRKLVCVKEEYLLISYTQFSNCVSNNRVNVDINPENDDNNPKSKVNKSKVEESRGEERKENKSIVNETKENQTIGEKRKGYYFVDLYSHALELFCNICKTLPKPKELTDERKLMIDMANIKLKEYGKTLEELFKIVDDSDFLSGRNGKWTGCNLEWVLKPANITKIMEGNYANQEGNYGNSNSLQPPLGKNPGITSSYDLEEYENKVVIENWGDLMHNA
ncbi:MAG: DUF4373 domain-containing protein [Ruminococcus sp.]|nr:DUF4373 domain-containing protein [Ruminococcus sp.]